LVNDREYELSLRRLRQDVDNFWTIVGIRTISLNVVRGLTAAGRGWYIALPFLKARTHQIPTMERNAGK